MIQSQLPTNSRLGGLTRDLTCGLKQQMFFWGKDVVHPDGNLLVRQGLEKSTSAGLQGTSCYGMDWQGGRIKLHGACAGWYPRDGGGGGFIFIRPLGKCFVWLGQSAPVPGEWSPDLRAPADFEKLRAAALPFLDWWLHSELWIGDLLGGSYRTNCFRHFKRLPRSRPWLPPHHGRPPGTDSAGGASFEYIEILSDTGGVGSLDDCKLLLLDTDGGNMGRVDGLWNLHGLATGGNDLLLLGVNLAASGGGPWAPGINPATAIADIAIPPGKDGLIEPNRS